LIVVRNSHLDDVGLANPAWSAFSNIQKNAFQDMREVVKSNLGSSRDEYAHNSKKQKEEEPPASDRITLGS
jgi:hypothetical protein